MSSTHQGTATTVLRAPPRREWPPGLREYAREHHLYSELELLRRLSPSTMIWLLENWDNPDGQSALDSLAENGAYDLLKLPNDGA